MSTYVVTSSVAGRAKSQVWDSSTPLPLGYPMQWLVERTESGIRVRHIGGRAGQILSDVAHEIPYRSLESGSDVSIEQLPGDKRHSLKIRKVAALAPVYSQKAGSVSESLTVFQCFGDWILRSVPLSDAYTGQSQEGEVFKLARKGDKASITSACDRLSLAREGKPAQTLGSGQTIELSIHELTLLQIASGHHRWQFGSANAVTVAHTPTERMIDSETAWFKKAMRAALVGLGAFAIMTWLWPKPTENPEELVPPQFAKIVLAKPQKAAPAAGGPEVAAPGKVAEKVQKTAVVQAFRAKALQNAVNGLLKGGMTRLMAQSDFVSGQTASADARRIFNTQSNALTPTSNVVGQMNDRNVQVAALGGAGGGGAGAVGYGKGSHASVNGQGKSFVSMDIAGSSVEEGLTKDEVGEVIHRHMSEIRYCYESAMVRMPDVEGKLIVNFTIGGPGNVKSSEVKQSTLPDPRLDDCILRRLVTWKFPNTKGGIDVAVSYPFIFKTLGR